MKGSLKRLIKPGKKFRAYYGENNPNNVLYHVRAIVDDDYVVVKHWVKHKKRWSYEVITTYALDVMHEMGTLVPATKKQPSNA
tara:strand:+ start:160 stop:408 length:249 start_codon:yes stop_codon:yes gene_type:complete